MGEKEKKKKFVSIRMGENVENTYVYIFDLKHRRKCRLVMKF